MLEKAIEEEDYERAAQLRDEIARLKKEQGQN
jgi:protein-arginine kinase activator protein McsA